MILLLLILSLLNFCFASRWGYPTVIHDGIPSRSNSQDRSIFQGVFGKHTRGYPATNEQRQGSWSRPTTYGERAPNYIQNYSNHLERVGPRNPNMHRN